jgi:hypothetical protein
MIQQEMTVEAARELWKALVWATYRADDEGRTEYREMLMWEMSRLGHELALLDELP